LGYLRSKSVEYQRQKPWVTSEAKALRYREARALGDLERMKFGGLEAGDVWRFCWICAGVLGAAGVGRAPDEV
jgi:hypothetical protein